MAYFRDFIAVFPAQAGVIPEMDPRKRETSGVSRASGGDPTARRLR